jgi:anti-anti-sigma factor
MRALDGKPTRPGRLERPAGFPSFTRTEGLESAVAQIEANSESFPTAFVVKRTRLDDTINLTVSGELDASTAPQLETEILAAKNDCVRLVIDLTGLTFIDSIGLGTLLSAKKLSQEHPFELSGIPSDHGEVTRIFALTDTEKAFG